MALQTVRGARDILPKENRKFRFIIDNARNLAERYGYDQISTPIIEPTEVFQRTLGEVSDVVSKEMYTFFDRNGLSLTLRPEGTAGIVRAIISEGLGQQVPLRYFYEGAMFRHERPQKGRYRQFHQIGVELVGSSDPGADIEVISLATHILEGLGLKEDVVLELNSLGDEESRDAYRSALVHYLKRFEGELSKDSQTRLQKNPLRILDSKNKTDKEILLKAPLFIDYLNKDSLSFFDEIRSGLDSLEIYYKINPKLVRGFDYYCHTAFEFTSERLGSQNALLAGGRYDGLSESMGGNPLAGVGWAAGIERLALLITGLSPIIRPIAIIPVGASCETHALSTTRKLRYAGYAIDMAFRGSLSRRMKRANKINARAAVILGERELKQNVVIVRDLDSGKQWEVLLDRLPIFLEKFLS